MYTEFIWMLTYEREGWWQHEEHAVTVHGKRDRKVHGEAAQNEESVHRRPVRHLKPQLWRHRENIYFYSTADLEKCRWQDEGSSYLDADGEQQTRLGQEGEGLVVGDVLPVVPHGVVHGGVGEEEEHQGAVAAVEGALEEGPLAEVQVELTGDVELRMLDAPGVVHILTSRWRQRHQVSVCSFYFLWP